MFEVVISSVKDCGFGGGSGRGGHPERARESKEKEVRENIRLGSGKIALVLICCYFSCMTFGKSPFLASHFIFIITVIRASLLFNP